MAGIEEVTLAKRFLSAYNALDQYLRAGRNDPRWLPHSVLITNSQEIPVSSKLKLRTYADLRNAIVHSERGIDSPIAEPHTDEVERYERLVQDILKPPSVMSKAVPVAKIFSVDYGNSLFEVIRHMNEKVYTHAPLLDSGCVVGVFSENTIFSYLGYHGEAILDSTLTIESVREFLPIESHISECFQFVSPLVPFRDVTRVFREMLQSRRRLGAVFITENGAPSERLLGMLTPWDIAGEYFS
jgi:predicted transcriptional regulator